MTDGTETSASSSGDRSADRLAVLLRLLLAGCLLAPAVAAPHVLFYPMVAPKVFLLRALAWGMAPLLAAIWVLDRRHRPGRGPVVLAVLLWGVVFAVSTFAGTDVRAGLFGSANRMMGLDTFAALTVVFLAATSVLRTWSAWRFQLRGWLLVAAYVAAVAFAEKAGWVLGYVEMHGRPSSTLGNPIFLAAYASVSTFLAWLLVTRETATGWRVCAAVSGVLSLVVLVLSESRGTAAGLAVGAAVAALVYRTVWHERRRIRRRIDGGLLAVLVLGVIGFFALDAGVVEHLPMARRLRLVKTGSGGVQRRFLSWQVAVNAGLERPLLGYGPRTYRMLFDRDFDPQMYRLDPGQVFADRAHNVPANTFAEQGTLGVLAYLLLLGAPVWVLLRRFESGRVDAHLVAVGVGAVASHFVHGLFAFDDPTSLLCFLLLLALIQSSGREEEDVAVSTVSGNRAGGLLAGGVVAVGSVVGLYLGEVRPARASYAHQRAVAAASAMLPDAPELFAQAAPLPTRYGDDFRLSFCGQVAVRAQTWLARGSRDVAREWTDLGYREIAGTLRQEPDHSIRQLLLAAELSRLQATEFDDDSHVEEIERRLDAAVRWTPRRPDLLFALAVAKHLAGKPRLAIRWGRDAHGLAPATAEANWRFAALLYNAGEGSRALTVIDRARNAGIRFEGAGRVVVEQILSGR